MFTETEQTENHTQDGYNREEDNKLRIQPLAYGVRITGYHNLARLLVGRAHTLFQCLVRIVRLQEQGTQCRRQSQGVDSRETDGQCHCDTKLLIERTGRTAHEAHRDKHGHHHQRDGHDSTTQFTHGVDGGKTG